jgi:hypothetical protein
VLKIKDLEIDEEVFNKTINDEYIFLNDLSPNPSPGVRGALFRT